MYQIGLIIICLVIGDMATNSMFGKEWSPVAGILMYQSEFDDFSYDTHYGLPELTTWVEQMGMRWFPIFITDSDRLLRRKVMNSNIIILPGGDIEIYDPSFPGEQKLTRFTRFIRNLVSIVIEYNDKKIYKPLWGICLGFQSIVLVRTDFTIEFRDDFNNLRKLQPTFFMGTSLFSDEFSESELQKISNQPTFWHSYNHGFTLDSAENCRLFRERIDLLATSMTLTGRTVIAAVKDKKYPFYGTLFHPEHVQFNHADEDLHEKTDDLIGFNRRIAKVMRKLVGKIDFSISNEEIFKYRRHMRSNFSLDKNQIFTFIDVPIHDRDE